MKKTCALVAVAVMLLPLLSRAQMISATPGIGGVKFSGGIKLGVNLARLNGSDWEGGYKTNLLGGAYASLHGGKFGVQVEGLFTQSSYTTGKDFYSIYNQYYNNAIDSARQGTFRVSYLSIPVLLQYRIMKRVWVQAGPQYSGIVNTKDNDKLVKDAGELFKSGSFSGVAGLWISLGTHLNVGGRYVFSFSDEKNITTQMASDAWKRRDIQVHLGFTF